MSATNPNSPIKPVFKPPPDGGEISWVSNNSAIHGIGTKVHWNSKGIRNVCKTKDHNHLDASMRWCTKIPFNAFWDFSGKIQQRQHRSTAGNVITHRAGFLLLYHLFLLLKSIFCLSITSEISQSDWKECGICTYNRNMTIHNIKWKHRHVLGVNRGKI